MLLTISTTHRPATDLGYLLHKHPDKLQTFPFAFGQIHVVYPELSDERCTAAILLDIDPLTLSRRSKGTRPGFVLAPYVNDRPYVASSFLSVAIGEVLGSALGGRSRERQELASMPIPLVATLSAIPVRGGAPLVEDLFGPLGYDVTTTDLGLDPDHPEWGSGNLLRLELAGTVRLADLLSHLYVLVPVLDDQKHYWVGDDELEKLLRRGEGWLATHPARELIGRRYLRHKGRLVRELETRLAALDGTDQEAADEADQAREAALERPISLHRKRLDAVVEELRGLGAARVVDLGCGEGRLIELLLAETRVTQILGVDVSTWSLAAAERRLRLDRDAGRQARVTLVQGALTYRDARLTGFDAAAVVEVVEHIDPARLPAFERALFGDARPGAVVLTTPNREYNARFEGLGDGHLRHGDHRFEWTRAQFTGWAEGVALRHGFDVRLRGVGEEDVELGAPSQMAVFTRRSP